MKEEGIDFDEKPHFFAGEDYIEFLKPHFSNCKSIYDGKGIGEIMHYLDAKNGDIDESLRNYLLYKIN